MKRRFYLESWATLFLLAGVVAVVSSGCGSISQTEIPIEASDSTTTVPDAERIPVVLGSVTSSVAGQPAELMEATCRYLRDQATTEIARHGIFRLVDTNEAMPGLLAQFGVADSTNAQVAIRPEAALDLVVTRLDEKLGATVKIGFVSSQDKHAVAEVCVTLRSLDGGSDLKADGSGKTTKGAWGVVTMVNRDAMKAGKGGKEVWKLDGSMVGTACVEAVREAMGQLEKQVLFRKKTLRSGIEDKLGKPGMMHPVK